MLYYLDRDPVEVSQSLRDTDLQTQVVKAASYLHSAHCDLGSTEYDGSKFYLLPKPLRAEITTPQAGVHALWVKSSHGNYKWTYGYFLSLLTEIFHRTGKQHDLQIVSDAWLRLPTGIANAQFSEPPSKTDGVWTYGGNAVSAFRDLYRRLWPASAQSADQEWTDRPVPSWLND